VRFLFALLLLLLLLLCALLSVFAGVRDDGDFVCRGGGDVAGSLACGVAQQSQFCSAVV
jgi:hypothetical protein